MTRAEFIDAAEAVCRYVLATRKSLPITARFKAKSLDQWQNAIYCAMRRVAEPRTLSLSWVFDENHPLIMPRSEMLRRMSLQYAAARGRKEKQRERAAQRARERVAALRGRPLTPEDREYIDEAFSSEVLGLRLRPDGFEISPEANFRVPAELEAF